MVGTEIVITGELAIAVGKLAAERHAGDAVRVAYDDDRAEQLWEVTFDNGAAVTGRYIVDDETGDAREVV